MSLASPRQGFGDMAQKGVKKCSAAKLLPTASRFENLGLSALLRHKQVT
jgi:hypothetical protein